MSIEKLPAFESFPDEDPKLSRLIKWIMLQIYQPLSRKMNFIINAVANGRVKTTTEATTTYQILITDNEIFANTDSGDWTTTLPLSPVEGQSYRIINCGSNVLTIARNVENIVGLAEDATLSASGVVILTYNATEGWW